ncbi:MAG: DUF4184 family protein [Actinomycetales bacterium]|nr:MAG: DUF4184 family protein [Actinomycetales bacterium]
MPFTAAHPLLVLPFRRTVLPLSALVAGSTVPDLPVFVQAYGAYAWTHSVLGILVVDPLLAVAVLGLWFAWVRDAVVDMLPDTLRSRLEAHAGLDRSAWRWVVPAAVLGALTHVLWDELTHPGRWGTRHWSLLAERHGPLIGATWFQYGSGVVGTAAVLGVAVQWFVRREVVDVRRPARRLPSWTWSAAIAVPLVCGVVLAAVSAPDGLHAMAFDAVVGSVVAGVAAATVAVLAWHLTRVRT